MTPRHGMTIPFSGPLHAQRARFEELAELGYSDLWSAEANGNDAFTPLALASVWTPTLRLGTSIVPAFTRGPALMAQHVGTLAQAAPGRVVFGIGTSSNVIVENWNGIPFDEPYKRTRDMVRFLRAALTGDKVTETYDSFEVKGFRLQGVVPDEPVPIVIAALRAGMLRLAGREGDGAVINWLSAENVKTVAGIVNEQGADKEVVARIFVAPTEDRETVLREGKFAMAAYLNVPVYRAFHEWMGRTDDLQNHWDRWAAGDRAGSLDEIPDHVVDELIVSGSPNECREHIARYFENGVTASALMILPLTGVDHAQAVRDLAPSSR